MDSIDKNERFLVLEYAVVLVCLLIPPLFSVQPFILPAKPKGWCGWGFFCLSTVCWAAYEEILYRLYSPHRLHIIYRRYIVPRVHAAQERQLLPERGGNTCLLLFYKKLTAGKITAFFFTELPAILLFTFAHRYLGVLSMLFAAIAGTVFRLAYILLTRVLSPARSILLVSAVHGAWNMGVYLYLWQ